MKGRALFLLLLALVLIQSSTGPQLLADSSGSYGMLIVGPETYGTAIGGFIDFKASQGVEACYVSIEFINRNQSDSGTVRRLHDFVASEHERAGIRYLLLVGTYDQVPTKYVYSPSYEYGLADYNYKPTDWYYGVPEWKDSEVGLLGGNLPEIAVGRLPVKNEEELERTLAKIVGVEANLESGSFLVFGDVNVALESALSAPYVYYSSNVNLTSKPLTQLLSSGAMHVVSYSHGTASALWTSDSNGEWKILMSCEQVPEINRTYGIQYIIACFTGALDLGNESLARVLITSPKGPALVIASSRIEMSGNLISSRFWEAMLGTGDVGGSIVEALRSYLLDQTIFPSGEYVFDYYNSYLNKVVYGDVSWMVSSQDRSPSASSGAPVQSSSQAPATGEVQSAGDTMIGSAELLAWLSAAGALSGCVLIAKARGRSPEKRIRPGSARDRVA